LIEAFQSPPLIALSNQWFGGAKNMLDISFAHLVGATLIDKTVWDKIPSAVQKEMLASARTAGVALRAEIRTAEAGSVPIMQQFGLNVVHPDAKTVAEWRQLTESIWPKFRGPVVPPDLFDEVKRLRDEYRKTHPVATTAGKK
jgi:TRAP-type C4-dicarboxylate transport system substrate-binding protein